MPTIDPDDLDGLGRYRLLINSGVPRPIAWVTTVDAAGTVNLAPFSFFNGITAKPPMLVISVGHRDPPKDTVANLRARREAVVHLPGAGAMEAVHQSGAEYRSDISEAEELDVGSTPAERVTPPRIAGSPVAFECVLDQVVEVGAPPANLCILRILLAHIAEEIAGDDGLPDPQRHRTVARLGDRCYLAARDWSVASLPKQQLKPDQRR